jgi:DNA-binding winged helix-turn-helix (wHTH) protein
MIALKPELKLYSDGAHYSFGQFCLYPDGTLVREAREVHLPPKELAVLRVLVVHAGQIVPPDQLRSVAWGEVHVSSDSLPRCVSSLRCHLESQECIQTIYKRGYRFVLPVKLTRSDLHEDNFAAQGETDRRTNHPKVLPRLAIMPFSTGDDVPALFGTAISEETMIRLAHTRNPVTELMARDSILHLVARGASAQEAGAALGADLALAGSITALPLHYRLRIEMIRVADAVQLWVEDFLLPSTRLGGAEARAAKHITDRIRNTFGTVIAPANTQTTADSTVVTAFREARSGETYVVHHRVYTQPPDIL